MSPATLKIDPEFKGELRSLNTTERVNLETLLWDEGFRDKLIVWNGIVIDGQNRFELWLEKFQEETDPKYTPRILDYSHKFDTREQVIAWIKRNQKGRRNDESLFSKVENVLQREPEIREQAKANQSHGQTAPGKNASGNVTKSVDTRAAIAAEAGVSPKTVAAVKQVLESGDEELIEKARSGEIKPHTAAKQAKKDAYPYQSVNAPPVFSPAIAKQEIARLNDCLNRLMCELGEVVPDGDALDPDQWPKLLNETDTKCLASAYRIACEGLRLPTEGERT